MGASLLAVAKYIYYLLSDLYKRNYTKIHVDKCAINVPKQCR